MKFENIKDIFFDLDHTLWDFDRNSALAFERVFVKNKIEVDFTEFIKHYEPINLAYWKLYRDEKVTQTQLRRGRLTDTFKNLNIMFDVEQLDKMALSYIDELPIDNHLFEGTIETLQYLTEKYNLHIITNGFHNVQHLKLKNSGLFSFFNTVTTSEDVSVKKPNSLIFNHALQKANALAESSLMVGDSFEADILGAENVGMHTIFFNIKNHSVASSYLQINNLSKLKSIL